MVEDGIVGERTGRVTHVGRRDISELTVASGKIPRNLDQAAVPEQTEVRESSQSSRSFKVVEINADKKLVVDAAEKKLEDLAEVLAEDSGDVCLMFEEDEDLENKVHDTLARHASFWRESGASNFAVSVVENGYVPQIWENPQNYEEKKNGSYREEKVWANKVVFKLARAKLVREVDRRSLCCVNPLTVAKNARGKKRLCIDH